MHFHSQQTSCVTYYDNVINRHVTLFESKDFLTNKEQLCQSFWQSLKEQKFKTKEIEGGEFRSTSLCLLIITFGLITNGLI